MMEDKTRYNLIPKNVSNINEKNVTTYSSFVTMHWVVSEIATGLSQACRKRRRKQAQKDQ